MPTTHAHHRRSILSYTLLPSLLVMAWPATKVLGQGCIGLRSTSCSVHSMGDETSGGSPGAGDWQASVAFRWFESKRDFVGDEEVPSRYGMMVNDVYAFDVLATYGINSRWSVTLDLPFTAASRTTAYEHDGINRHTMRAGGLGDLRLTTDYWLLDPHQHMNGNIALGLGFSAPTGDDAATDTAHRATGPVERPVDTSIQPGSGGWGLIVQMQAYQQIVGNLFGYLNGFYTFTPEEQNDTEYPTADRAFSANFLTYRQTHNSIADQYLLRGGLSYAVWPAQGLQATLGARWEGIPPGDIIGGDLGYRRPGYSVSIEPGLAWNRKSFSVTLTAPVALYRNRQQSVPEEELGRPPGDAAFADFSILAGFTWRF